VSATEGLQIEYCRNFIFKRHFPIHKLFERSCELGLWRLTANKISEIFGQRLHRKISGKLATVIDQIEHGHHVYRAYFKHAFLKQYEAPYRTALHGHASRNARAATRANGSVSSNGCASAYMIMTLRVSSSRYACSGTSKHPGPLKYTGSPDLILRHVLITTPVIAPRQ
jgi:hypothetical protein